MMRKPTPWIVTSLLSKFAKFAKFATFATLGVSAWTLPALAQDAPAAAPAAAAPAVTPAAPAEAAPAEAAPAAAPAVKKKAGGGGGSLGLDPQAPQASGLVTTSAVVAASAEEPATGEWKFDVTGYFRAPFRFSWGPPTVGTATVNGMQVSTSGAGTQFRTPPLVPDANYIDWRYTNSFVAPWTELNFHYGNDRVKATVQIASYNVTDSGYRRLESNLGINEAFLQMSYPELANVEWLHLDLTAGAFTNRYGAAGRYDAGRYETYLFGRTHVAGETVNVGADWNDFTFQAEETFGAKLEPIPFYGRPLGSSADVVSMGATTGNANQDLPAWEPYPGPLAQESTFVASIHGGVSWKKMVIAGAHLIDVFANDNEASTAYEGAAFGPGGRAPNAPKPYLHIYGADVKFLGGVFGDGYIGYSRLSAENAMYLADAIEVLHSFGGWQLHDNYFGKPGATDEVTGTIDSVEFQYSFSFGQLFHYPQAFWGDGPDLIGTIFGMFNHVNAPVITTKTNKLKFGTEWTYVPLSWLGLGARYDVVEPDLSQSPQSFSVISPRIIFRTAFVTHEQVMLQYSRYFYGSAYGAGQTGGMFPYDSQSGGASMGVDKNAAQIAAIIWF
jgi:hypothetical protein